MLDAPALPPPAVVAPAPREVSFGLVAGTAPRGTRGIIVRVGNGRRRRRAAARAVLLAARRAADRATSVQRHRGRRPRPPLDAGRRARATACRREPSRASARRRSIPCSPERARARAALWRHDAASTSRISAPAGAPLGTRARASRRASTLKLAIAVTVLRSLDGKPAAGTQVARLLRQDARRLGQRRRERARGLARRLDVGRLRPRQRDDAGARPERLAHVRRLRDRAAARGRRPRSRSASRASRRFGVGKYTTAWDLARLARAVYLAAAGKGPLLALGVSGSEARYLLWLLQQVSDRGKLDRFIGTGPIVMHKAGWLPGARHDNGIVSFGGGAYVASVMTWQTPRGGRARGPGLARGVYSASVRRRRRH